MTDSELPRPDGMTLSGVLVLTMLCVIAGQSRVQLLVELKFFVWIDRDAIAEEFKVFTASLRDTIAHGFDQSLNGYALVFGGDNRNAG